MRTKCALRAEKKIPATIYQTESQMRTSGSFLLEHVKMHGSCQTKHGPRDIKQPSPYMVDLNTPIIKLQDYIRGFVFAKSPPKIYFDTQAEVVKH
jgi:hypothetical protein